MSIISQLEKEIIARIREHEHLKYFCVIDLETLAKTKDSIVFNAAAILMHIDKEPVRNDEISISFDINLSIDDQIKYNRELDQDTLMFWMKRSKTFEKIMSKGVSPYKEGILLFYETLMDMKVKYNPVFFFRGMDFDLPILHSMFKDINIDIKKDFGYNSFRDVRSFIDAKLNINRGYIPGLIKEPVLNHSALYDAMHDAEQIILANDLAKKIELINSGIIKLQE